MGFVKYYKKKKKPNNKLIISIMSNEIKILKLEMVIIKVSRKLRQYKSLCKETGKRTCEIF